MSRWLLATMTAVLFVALVIAVTGVESLMSSADVITQPDATPYLGPAMVTAVAIVVFCATATGARRGSPIGSGLVGAATAYLVMLGVGSLAYALIHADPAQLVVFPAAYALGPFVVGTVVIALVVVVGAIVLARHEQGRAGAPRNGH